MTHPPRSPHDSEDVYSFTYDATEDDQPALAIVEAVSWISDVGVLDLTPLHDVYDTENLNRQFGSPDRGEFYRSASQAAEGSPSVTFQYEGYTVTITAERIEIVV